MKMVQWILPLFLFFLVLPWTLKMVHVMSVINLVDVSLVFIADTGKECFVWIGKEASQSERRQAMSYAHVSPFIHLFMYINYILLTFIGLSERDQTSLCFSVPCD